MLPTRHRAPLTGALVPLATRREQVFGETVVGHADLDQRVDTEAAFGVARPALIVREPRFVEREERTAFTRRARHHLGEVVGADDLVLRRCRDWATRCRR